MANNTLGHNENKNLVNLDEWVKQYMSDSQADVAELKDKVDNMWKTIYPVGSIYLTMNGENPSTYWGGTWVLWGSGRVPVCINTGDSDFEKVGKTGGEKKHALTDAEMPAHDGHVTMTGAYTILQGQAGYYVGSGRPYRNIYSNEVCPTNTTYGRGIAHNVMQPYIVCYMWRRTA